ncbi:MAG TPA: hypothetical protein VFN26_02520 [Candidatus Acidoferrum sp.]|nr:hypothetical protein [Candidatus Acidoferrum sp.]
MKKTSALGLCAYGGIVALAFLLPVLPALAQQPEDECRPVLGSVQQETNPVLEKKKLFRIEVEDAIEAELITQQLKIKPQLLEGHSFYYCGDEGTNKLLDDYGYDPVPTDPEEAFSRVVRIARKGNEEDLRDLGVTMVLREREFWVVRATLRQLRVLQKLGYAIKEIGKEEPRPRQVRVTVRSMAQVEQAGKLGIDIYSVARAEKGRDAIYIYGGAFDYAIDELEKHGFRVEILPDPEGVKR